MFFESAIAVSSSFYQVHFSISRHPAGSSAAANSCRLKEHDYIMPSKMFRSCGIRVFPIRNHCLFFRKLSSFFSDKHEVQLPRRVVFNKTAAAPTRSPATAG
jgi:hypothetical protein